MPWNSCNTPDLIQLLTKRRWYWCCNDVVNGQGEVQMASIRARTSYLKIANTIGLDRDTITTFQYSQLHHRTISRNVPGTLARPQSYTASQSRVQRCWTSNPAGLAAATNWTSKTQSNLPNTTLLIIQLNSDDIRAHFRVDSTNVCRQVLYIWFKSHVNSKLLTRSASYPKEKNSPYLINYYTKFESPTSGFLCSTVAKRISIKSQDVSTQANWRP